jgi:hypothetical protein
MKSRIPMWAALERNKMQMTTTKWILVSVAAAALGFGAGQLLKPAKVVTKVEERVVEKVVYRDRLVKEQGPVRIVTKTVTTPGKDGPTITVEKVVEKEKIVTVRVRDGESTTNSTTVSEKTVTNEYPRFTVLGTVGTDVNLKLPIVYGGQALYRVLGPIQVGAGYDSSNRATILIGGTF